MGGSANTDKTATTTITTTNNTSVTEIGTVGLTGANAAALAASIGSAFTQANAQNTQLLSQLAQGQNNALTELATMQAASQSMAPNVNLGAGTLQSDAAVASGSNTSMVLVIGVVLVAFLLLK